MQAALRRARPAQVLAIALETADARVLHIAADEVARNPSLLQHTDFRDPVAQEVWARALAINAEAWRGPSDPQQSFIVVIDGLLEGRPANAALLTILSSAPVADLCDYPRRAEVWRRVDGVVLENLLKATAVGWLKRVTAEGGVPSDLDREIETVLLAGDALEQALLPYCGRSGHSDRLCVV